MSYTTDPNDPRLCKGPDNEETPQCDVYLVLSEEERKKGFVRPYRDSYIHVGRHYNKGIRILEKPEIFNNNEYVAVATVLIDDDGNPRGGAYLTQKELDQYYKTGGYVGGCGGLTKMSEPISETYARNPSFYSSTYCVHCKKHIPVHEFVWDGTNERVGS